MWSSGSGSARISRHAAFLSSRNSPTLASRRRQPIAQAVLGLITFFREVIRKIKRSRAVHCAQNFGLGYRRAMEAQRSLSTVGRRSGAATRLIARHALITLTDRIVDSSALFERGDNMN